MKEYLIDDIEVLEEDVYESMAGFFDTCKRQFEELGYRLKITTTSVLDEEKSKITFNLYGKNCSMSFSFCFIARGKNGGYYVAPSISNGDCESKIKPWVERVKALIKTKGFEEAKMTFNDEVRDCYKEVDYLKWIMTGVIVLGIVGIVGVIAVTLISVLI